MHICIHICLGIYVYIHKYNVYTYVYMYMYIYTMIAVVKAGPFNASQVLSLRAAMKGSKPQLGL